MFQELRAGVVVTAASLLLACTGVASVDPKYLAPASPPGPEETPSCASAVSSPAGRVSLRRLNGFEYDNTVRDLLGDASAPSQRFAAHDDVDVEGGFDNNGHVLTVNSQLLSDWRAAADRLAQLAAASPAFMTCSPSDSLSAEACARQVLTPFLRRAWRRAVREEDLDSALSPFRVAQAHGDTFAKGIELAVIRVLLSPNFVYRVEPVPEPASPRLQPLDGFAVASRLSYFLWRSTPDDALLAAAQAGALAEPAGLDEQVTRMLADEKAAAMIHDLSGQWLLGRAAQLASPDPIAYPRFDSALREGLRTETELFLGEFIREDLDLSGLLGADFTFVNDRLAAHYGLPAVSGSGFRKVSLEGNPQRGGLLTQGSIHLGTMTNPRLTSVQVRGVWALTRLLCTQLPDPPPEANQLQEELVATLGPDPSKKEIAAARSALPACGGCHRMFDPIGFGLENYDITGGWRTEENGHPVDARGELAGLGAFDGPRELSAALRGDPRLKACMARTLLTFALGRGFHAEDDACQVDAATQAAASRGFGGAELIRAVVKSPAFLQHSGESDPPCGDCP